MERFLDTPSSRFLPVKTLLHDWGEERMAFGAFARFDKNRNHYLQGIEIESFKELGVGRWSKHYQNQK